MYFKLSMKKLLVLIILLHTLGSCTKVEYIKDERPLKEYEYEEKDVSTTYSPYAYLKVLKVEKNYKYIKISVKCSNLLSSYIHIRVSQLYTETGEVFYMYNNIMYYPNVRPGMTFNIRQSNNALDEFILTLDYVYNSFEEININISQKRGIYSYRTSSALINSI